MAKERSRLADYLTYLLVRIFVGLMQVLTVRASHRFSGILAILIHRIDKRHRLVAEDNLVHAFGDSLNTGQRQAMVRDVYKHFCGLLMEIIHLPRKLHVNNWRDHLELGHGEEIIECLLSGRPMMFVSGHFGNWEMGGFVLGLLGFKTHAIARPLDNPYLDDFLRRFREGTGQKLLAKKGDFDQMQAILAQGGALATLGDQDAGERGLFVDFFNRPASTHKAIALLSLEYKVPLVVTLSRNLGKPMNYQIASEGIIHPEDYSLRADAVKAITQRFTAALEHGIRKAPEQYFWLHRRWKHPPPKSKRKAA